jgi:hypothetical protein
MKRLAGRDRLRPDAALLIPSIHEQRPAADRDKQCAEQQEHGADEDRSSTRCDRIRALPASSVGCTFRTDRSLRLEGKAKGPRSGETTNERCTSLRRLRASA